MTEGRCQCDNGDPCPNALSDPKNVKCRPCALGWHRSVTCDRYRPEAVKHLVRTCAECGFDSAAHPIPSGAFLMTAVGPGSGLEVTPRDRSGGRDDHGGRRSTGAYSAVDNRDLDAFEAAVVFAMRRAAVGRRRRMTVVRDPAA